MKEKRKIPLTHIMIIGAFIFAFLQVRIMVESLQHILSVQTGING